MPDGVRMRISSLLAVVMALPLVECRWYTIGTMDTLVPDDLAAGDGQKLLVVAYGALLDMVLRGTIAAGGTRGPTPGPGPPRRLRPPRVARGGGAWGGREAW